MVYYLFDICDLDNDLIEAKINFFENFFCEKLFNRVSFLTGFVIRMNNFLDNQLPTNFCFSLENVFFNFLQVLGVCLS
jgi:hypothetical protein